ncbi:MAG: DUF4835 family protein [Ignavibacteriaceae bacterium]|nr:DUF4835 family protein [Ignavibacteriaceae bacterium]
MKKLTVFLIVIFSGISLAQELNCKVLVNYENLSVSSREKLVNFASVVEDYMNKTKFSPEEWEGEKIECTLNIFFLSASGEVNYSAQVVVVSQRPIYKSINNSPILTINDPQWSFTFQEGQALYSGQSTFDPLTGFLDYYANLIIGMDWDTWEKLSGTQYFSKAFDIVNLGAASQFSAGWEKNSNTYSRRGIVEDLLNDKFRQFREAIYEYHLGVDAFDVYRDIAMQKIVSLVTTLDAMKSKIDINSVLVRVFFDAKSGEITDKLKLYPDKNIFKTLKKIDPSHASKYDEAVGS